jgi:lipid-binding SYLF domain-containing protein
MDADNDANKRLYGKEVGAKEIVTGSQEVVPAAKRLVRVLDEASPARK